MKTTTKKPKVVKINHYQTIVGVCDFCGHRETIDIKPTTDGNSYTTETKLKDCEECNNQTYGIRDWIEGVINVANQKIDYRIVELEAEIRNLQRELDELKYGKTIE